jgi:hypothetical protein
MKEKIEAGGRDGSILRTFSSSLYTFSALSSVQGVPFVYLISSPLSSKHSVIHDIGAGTLHASRFSPILR